MQKGLRLQNIVAALAVTLCVAAAPAPLCAEGLGQDKFKPGDTAPDFTLKSLSGESVQLSKNKGSKVVLLNFWGLRCGACLEELPYLEDLHKRYAAKGLAVIGVDTDGVDIQTVKDTMAEIGAKVSYPILIDPEFTATDTYTNFLVPLTAVIDKAGVITYFHTGFEKGTEKQYEDAVKKALGL